MSSCFLVEAEFLPWLVLSLEGGNMQESATDNDIAIKRDANCSTAKRRKRYSGAAESGGKVLVNDSGWGSTGGRLGSFTATALLLSLMGRMQSVVPPSNQVRNCT